MKFEDLFEAHEPPSGGLEALRARMAEMPARRARRRRALLMIGTPLAAAAALALAIAIPWWGGRGEDPFSQLLSNSADPSLARFDLAEAPGSAVSVLEEARSRSAVMEVPLSSDEVVFYWVVSIAPPEAEPPTAEPPPT